MKEADIFTMCVASFLSTRKDTNGNQLSEEVLHQVMDNQPKVPVIVDFSETVVGSTIRYNFSGNVVFCEFGVKNQIAEQNLFTTMYLVPIFEVHSMHRDGSTKIVDEATLTKAMLTYLPANPSMSQIKLRR